MEEFVNPVKLDHKHLANCVVLPDRYAILNKLPSNAIVAEIGVLAGDFSEFIIRETNPSQLVLIDTFNIDDWSGNEYKRFYAKNHFDFVNQRFKNDIDGGKVVLKRGFSWKMLKEFPDNYFDWIYLDADHKYPGVSKDLSEAIRVVKSSGYIVLNDYIFYSHQEAFPYGVIHAVNEVCVNHDYEIIYLALHPQMYCDVVIRQIGCDSIKSKED
ncbi:class I SAM-dependent methyltransferase [Rufibacter sp. XAAS-G3-1]|uniref:class I SAM-dependent methyltransferase n=1 Tax=Rufibacter sp. XAAS-G3-1 TaxID=2729134 RepID=UPI0015E71F7E|nr:class I SAM-dependent methyltransferase [Rufibacter sp. XAAS-G3-1]